MINTGSLSQSGSAFIVGESNIGIAVLHTPKLADGSVGDGSTEHEVNAPEMCSGSFTHPLGRSDRVASKGKTKWRNRSQRKSSRLFTLA